MKAKIVWKNGVPFCTRCGKEIDKSDTNDYGGHFVFCLCQAWDTKEKPELARLLYDEESDQKQVGQITLF